MSEIRVKYSGAVTFEQVAAAAPAGYSRAFRGEDKEPGKFGEGIAGEPLVVLLPGDSGAWFDALVTAAEAA